MGWYPLGKMGMKSLMGHPKTIIIGGHFGGLWVWSISVLEDGSFYSIHIKGTTRACVVHEDLFYGLDTCFSSAVAVWEGNRG